MRSAFENQGEICLCGSRLFVEAPLYDRFVAAFADAVGKLRIGDPLDEATEQGALVSAGAPRQGRVATSSWRARKAARS